jgi:hypothetical protein
VGSTCSSRRKQEMCINNLGFTTSMAETTWETKASRHRWDVNIKMNLKEIGCERLGCLSGGSG